MKLVNLVILSVNYHRNGVCGEPFYAVKFRVVRYPDILHGIVFDAAGRVAVIDPLNTSAGYRGDHFESSLREAIDQHIKKADREILRKN